jgi:site-specific DNA-methyltransferase (adenine-specific)
MKPYYADESVTLYHGDCREILPTLGDRSFDCVITDPPYSNWTHENVRSNSDRARGHGNRVLSGSLGFDSITDDDLRTALVDCGRITRRWLISNLDYRHAFRYTDDPPAGLRLLRIGVWIKTNPMPQISGDRPGQGWEAIAFLHRVDTKPSWHGKGRSSVWTLPVGQERNGHPTTKPLPMIRDWVRLFTDARDSILDPFAGSGTTLRAAKDEGRYAVGIEVDEQHCEIAAKRLAQGVLDFGGVA